ncbi:MAG TPA: protein nirD [Chromatiaceae bacterium]|nr:protein nirD [Chromatiaceae bacterium]
MADRVKCLYCGKAIPQDVSHCPHCGAVSHFQQKGYRAGVRNRFMIWLLVLTLVSFFLILWLPR